MEKLLIQDLQRAIDGRWSCRAYNEYELTETELGLLERFVKQLELPFTHHGEMLLRSTADAPLISPQVKTANVGLFTAPDTLAEKAKLGFWGELFILYCTHLEINTCWVGAFRAASAYRTAYGHSRRKEDKRIYCVCPLGHAVKPQAGEKKLQEHEQRRFTPFLAKTSLTQFPEEIKRGLAAAVKAPSGINLMPWLFDVQEENEVYRVTFGKTKKLRNLLWKENDIDIGVAAAHFWLTLASEDYPLQVEINEHENNISWSFICG